MDRLVNLIEESRHWASVGRGSELPPLVCSMLMNVFHVDCGFFVYRRRAIDPSGPLVYHPFGILEDDAALLQAEMDEGKWFYRIDQSMTPFAEWNQVTQLPNPWRSIFDRRDIRRAGIWPIRFGEETVGAMVLGRLQNENCNDSSAISCCATQVSLVLNLIAARRVAEIDSRKDALTGTWNRRGFDLVWPKWEENAVDMGSHVLIGILDVNNFKKINDEQGHMYGDGTLVEVSQCLESTIGPSGLYCRWGGDEFVFACAISGNLEKFQRNFIEEIMEYTQPVSVGIAILGKDGGDFARCLLVADRRMYEHKHGSRQFV